MGFGMRKEVYTRKPRVPFIQIRKLYDVELKSSQGDGEKIGPEFSSEQIQRAKEKIRSNLIKEQKRRFVLWLLTLLVSLSILSFLAYYILNP